MIFALRSTLAVNLLHVYIIINLRLLLWIQMVLLFSLQGTELEKLLD